MLRIVHLILLMILSVVTSGATTATDLEIDRIDFSGAKIFAEDVLDRVLEIRPGDKLERAKVIRTEQSIQALYRYHGYEEVSIRARLSRKSSNEGRFPKKNVETVLEFSIEEGSPTRIKRVHLSQNGPKEHEKRLVLILDGLVGEVFDQEKVSQLKRSMQEYFITEDFIGTQIDVEVSAADPKRKEVALEFRVNPGDRVSFGFRGNQVFTRGFLSSLVDEQRILGLGKDFKGAIKSKLEEEYRNVGFARVKIQDVSVEKRAKVERRIIYLIEEGPQVRIQSLKFDGNSVFKESDLREKFFSKASSPLKNGLYVEKDVQKAAELLIEDLKERGYLSARLITISSQYNSPSVSQLSESQIKLVIYIYEGEQTLVQGIHVQGAKVLKEETIKSLLRTEEKEPLNLFALGEGIEALKKAYLGQGYLGVKILNEGTDNLVRYSQENRLADIFIEIEEGHQFRVSQIFIEGLVNTKEWTIRRELEFKEGEILEEPKLLQSERELRKLGIFSSVNFQIEDDEEKEGYKIVRIGLSEADRGILTLGPGYRNDLGLRLFGQLAYSNLFGENHTLLINANVNRRLGDSGISQYNFVEAQGQIAYAWPWFGVQDLTFRPAIAVGKTQFINFAADNISISASFEKPILSEPNLLGNLTYSFERINQTNAKAQVDNQKSVIGTLSPKIALDLRDNSLVPTSGFFATAWMDFAYPFLGSQAEPVPIGYYRAQARTDFYVPLLGRLIWFQSFRSGYEKSTARKAELNTPDAIPLIKQFALGGVSSMRGYWLQELNKTYHGMDRLVQSSLAYANSRTELDFLVAGSLQFALFLDAGALYIDHSVVEGVKYGAGFGLHYLTPVGAVNLDWGFKLNPQPNDEPYVVHISVGVI